MFFDAEDVSHQLRFTGKTISFIPDQIFLNRPNLAGAHIITVSLYGSYREKLETKTLRFYILTDNNNSDSDKLAMIESGKNLKPPVIQNLISNGKIYTGFDYNSYHDSGVASLFLDAHGNGYKGKWFYNYNLSLDTEENKHQQTLQRFRLATGYTKSIQLNIGDNWPTYNSFILDGIRVRGFEIKLKTPKSSVNLDFIFGASGNSVSPYFNTDELNAKHLADTTATLNHNDSMSCLIPGIYDRKMLSTRLHFGSGKLFKLGINLFKAKDDSLSINQKIVYLDSIYKMPADSEQFDTISLDTVISGETPKDNIAMGADIRLNIWKRKISLFAHYAMSFITDDISGGAATADEISKAAGKDINLVKQPEDIENIFIVNGSTLPLPIPSDSTKIINNGALKNVTAWDAGFRFNYPFNSIRETFNFKYLYVGPNFKSLGNEYLSINKKGINISNELSILNGKIFIKGEIKYFRNISAQTTGYDKYRSNFSLLTTVMLNSNLPYFTIYLIKNNETSKHKPELSQWITPRKNNTTKNNMVGSTIQYTREFKQATHTLALTYNYNNNDTRLYDSTLTRFALIGNVINIFLNSSLLSFPIQTRGGLFLYYSKGDYSVNKITPSAGITWNIKPQKMFATMDLNWSHTNDEALDPDNYITIKSSYTYDISSRHSFYAKIGLDKKLNTGYTDRNLLLTYEFRY